VKGSLVEDVNVVILFKIDICPIMGSLPWDSFYGVYGALFNILSGIVA